MQKKKKETEKEKNELKDENNKKKILWKMKKAKNRKLLE